MKVGDKEAGMSQPGGQERVALGCVFFLWFLIYFVLQSAFPTLQLLYGYTSKRFPLDLLCFIYFLCFIYLFIYLLHFSCSLIHMDRLKQCSQSHCEFRISQRWAGKSLKEKGVIHTVCLWWLITSNDPRPACISLLSEACEPHSHANQLQTASWFHWQ